MVRRVLDGSGRDDLLDTAELLVSEVVTNALMYTGTSIHVAMSVDADGLMVEVGDGSPHLPQRRHYALTAHTGRGLALLDEAAESWGVVPGIAGKTVWFRLTSARALSSEPETSGIAQVTEITAALAGGYTAPVAAGGLAPASSTVDVDLLNLPLLLHAAWRQHAEATLREYLLASLDLGLEEDPLAVHAAATDATAVLAEHIPRPLVGGDRVELLRRAAEPYVTAPRVTVPVPVESVPHFHTLDATLESARNLAATGALLSPPPQPELHALRRWICTQVDEQSRGAVPSAWSPEPAPNPSRQLPPRCDIDGISESAEAVVAADEESTIVAVSDAAVELLGYERRAELVQQRLVTVIPHRYRQAHLAGVTVHLLTGRGPLIDAPVLVPALRRDGTETTVELHIRRHMLPHGRYVFVATLRPTEG